jgi:hypothetical protein
MRGYDGSTFHRHVPDLLLQHRNGAFTVVDVKPRTNAEEAQGDRRPATACYSNSGVPGAATEHALDAVARDRGRQRRGWVGHNRRLSTG